MITKELFLGCIWSFFIIAVITAIFQWKVRKNPWSNPYDGLLAAAGMIFLFSYTLLVSLLALSFYHLAILPEDLAYEQASNQFLRLQLVSTALNTISLWLVKLGLLCALYPLVNDNRHLRFAWLSTWIALLVSWTLCMACDPVVLQSCTTGCSSKLAMSYVHLWIYTISDTVTNSLVMLLPLTMLLVAKTPTRQKLLPAARFGSTAIIIGLSSARLGASYTGTFFANLYWLHFFGSLQCCVAITLYNALGALQHRNKQTRQSYLIMPKAPIEARGIQIDQVLLQRSDEGETRRTAPHCNKSLPPLPTWELSTSLVRDPQSQTHNQLSTPRTGDVYSAFSFSTASDV